MIETRRDANLGHLDTVRALYLQTMAPLHIVIGVEWLDLTSFTGFNLFYWIQPP